MNSKEIYDIIIENTINDWRSFMANNTKIEWETPKYSKSEINKSGEIIASKNASKQERDEALVILNNWRAAHAYPLRIICNNLRRGNPEAIVVQRLKRLDSIIGKIERFPEMKLYRMQDLGGCRVIVETIDQVYEAIEGYKNSRVRHILKREYDYINQPKNSGYRSFHAVYQFQSDRHETYNRNMLIEIQFRTRLQHIWATAVEMMGIYTKSNLKSSQGDEEILRFFALVSSVIAIKEKMPTCPGTSINQCDLIKEIKYLDKKHNIISTLSSINIAIDYTSERIRTKYIYYMLVLDYTKRKVRIAEFKSTELEVATKAYSKIENDTDTNVVLVSANSFDSLRIAYPNYFVDISNFITMIREMM